MVSFIDTEEEGTDGVPDGVPTGGEGDTSSSETQFVCNLRRGLSSRSAFDNDDIDSDGSCGSRGKSTELDFTCELDFVSDLNLDDDLLILSPIIFILGPDPVLSIARVRLGDGDIAGRDTLSDSESYMGDSSI